MYTDKKTDDTDNKRRFTNSIIGSVSVYIYIYIIFFYTPEKLAKCCLAFFVELLFPARRHRISEFWYLHRSLWMPYQLAINPSCARSRLIIGTFLF